MVELFVGGKYQGQNALAERLYGGITADGENDSIESIKNADVIVNFHCLIKRLMKNNIDPLEFSDKIKAKAVACDEVGCGVVPMDREQILYRENVGRCCCLLGKKAEKITRVICGIGVKIK